MQDMYTNMGSLSALFRYIVSNSTTNDNTDLFYGDSVMPLIVILHLKNQHLPD